MPCTPAACASGGHCGSTRLMTTGPAELDWNRPGISGGAGIGGGVAAPLDITAPAVDNVTEAPLPAAHDPDDDENDGRKLPDSACRSASSNDVPSCRCRTCH